VRERERLHATTDKSGYSQIKVLKNDEILKQFAYDLPQI
jgi:hypothetical protein